MRKKSNVFLKTMGLTAALLMGMAVMPGQGTVGISVAAVKQEAQDRKPAVSVEVQDRQLAASVEVKERRTAALVEECQEAVSVEVKGQQTAVQNKADSTATAHRVRILGHNPDGYTGALATKKGFDMDKDGFLVKDGILVNYNGNSAYVTVPDGVTSIGLCAFQDHPELVSVTLPESVKQIGVEAFRGCSKLQSVYTKNVKVIHCKAFEGCRALRSINFTEGLTEIAEGAFQDCTSLYGVRLPGTLVELGNSAFRNCSDLGYVNFGAECAIKKSVLRPLPDVQNYIPLHFRRRYIRLEEWHSTDVVR